MFFDKKSKAMSFAELVVVLAIIGTVSAITLPGLKKYSQRTELGEQARKAYLNLEDAIDNAVLTEGPVRNWNFSSTKKIFFQKYIIPNMKATSSAYSMNSADEFTSVDGMKYTFDLLDRDRAFIEVDVNNTKPPNIKGKDIFMFEISQKDEKVVPSDRYGTKELWQNNWKFTKELWEKNW